MVVRGVQMQVSLKRWHFSDILSKELINFTAVVDSDNMINLHFKIPPEIEK